MLFSVGSFTRPHKPSEQSKNVSLLAGLMGFEHIVGSTFGLMPNAFVSSFFRGWLSASLSAIIPCSTNP